METTRPGLAFLAKCAGVAALPLLLTDLALAQGSFVKVIGVRTRTNFANSSITVSVPSSGVAAGNSIVVTVHVGNLGGAVACSDPANAAYDTDVSSAAGGAGIAIASKHNVAALAFGQLITCTYPAFDGASSAGAYEFSGLVASGALDQTVQNAGTAPASASSGLTAPTTQANELVFGLFWLSNPGPTETFAVATSGGNPLESPYSPPYTLPFAAGTQKPMYRFVNSIRQYEANGTVGGTGDWKAQVATYKLVPDLCAGVNCDDGNPCTVDSCDHATGLCSNAAGNAGAICRAAADACDVAETCDGASAACPANLFALPGSVCGDPTSTGDCDQADSCDGAGGCLANRAANGTFCGDAGSACVNQDTCLDGFCHDNGFAPAGAACGDPSSAQCDDADTCSGSGACQANQAAAGTACGDPSSGPCDAADSCDGSGACQSNPVAGGTPCSDDEECTLEDACDGAGSCVGEADELCFACKANSAPVVAPTVAADPSEPTPLTVGNVAVTAAFTDAPGQTHTCTIAWGDESAPDAGVITEPTLADPGSCAGFHHYTAVGAYEVTIAITDMCGESGGAVYQYAVVYDPNGGFLAGGGWINSPAGAYAPDPTLTGKANFGFVAKYQKGGAVPTGEAQFRFHAASFGFDSTSYDWLVISGAKGRLRGVGMVNGEGEFSFELTAWDGQINGGGGMDRFRIKIWDKATNAVVYDNQLGAPDNADPNTQLGGGAILIQKK